MAGPPETVPVNNLTDDQRNYLINCLGRKFVVSTISKIGLFYNNRDYFEELIQEGMIGLWIASRKYDPTKSSFSTYAFYWVKAYTMAKFKKEINLKKPNMVMGKRMVDENNKRYFVKYKGTITSLNEPLKGIIDNAGELTVEDIIGDQSSYDQLIDIENKQDTEDKMREVKASFKFFHDTRKKENVKKIVHDIFYKRVLSEDPMALHELAEIHNVTKQRIDQLEKEMLRHIFSEFGATKNMKLLVLKSKDKLKNFKGAHTV